jgi:ZIP family zinc transporter
VVDFFLNLNYLYQALLAGLFTWFITLIGSMLVYFFKNVDITIMDIMLSIAAGVMLAASFFSLLLPAINLSSTISNTPWLCPSLGFALGGFILYYLDIFFQSKLKNENKHQNILLIISITLHNIPEGLAVGIAFGSLKYGMTNISSAIMLAVGIGIQNFPEGAAISLPLKRSGLSANKSFFLGQLSGFVEPISAFLGALLALKLRIVLPFVLTLAAGAMIYVIVAELIPSRQDKKNNIYSLFILFGFVIMMILDVAFS